MTTTPATPRSLRRPRAAILGAAAALLSTGVAIAVQSQLGSAGRPHPHAAGSHPVAVAAAVPAPIAAAAHRGLTVYVVDSEPAAEMVRTAQAFVDTVRMPAPPLPSLVVDRGTPDGASTLAALAADAALVVPGGVQPIQLVAVDLP